MTDQDTREKLEEDIRRAADEMEKFTFGERFIDTHKIIRWLDRQAAITEREAIERWDDKALAMYYAALDRAHSNEIEAEIEREWMRLPVDADGVPIRVGDTMTDGVKRRVVLAVSADSWQGDDSYYGYSPTSFRHVKPRTVEDVLAEFAGDVRNGKWSLDMEQRYADEIRELMGGDAE
ncbi:MAG: hypothetical protein IJ113_00975 [Eggerthellaceae bacterium]|nr:hypothetical protein [Eggerthellaceae bacterium]